MLFRSRRRAARAEHFAGLPSQWRGKRYRRQEEAKNPQESEEAENSKRERWAKEVLGLLLEADLPFAATAREARGGLTGPTALRCCRGLWANTLKKRVDDWRPFRRWLLAEGHRCFPDRAQQVLDFLDVQWEASAPRTFYQSFLDALTFFETAGERPEAERLSESQAVKNAVRAFTARLCRGFRQSERLRAARPDKRHRYSSTRWPPKSARWWTPPCRRTNAFTPGRSWCATGPLSAGQTPRAYRLGS